MMKMTFQSVHAANEKPAMQKISKQILCDWLHWIMHRTVGLTGYMGSLTLVRSFVSPIVPSDALFSVTLMRLLVLVTLS